MNMVYIASVIDHDTFVYVAETLCLVCCLCLLYSM